MKDEIQEYMDNADRFSSQGELYQGVPGGETKASRDLTERWKLYGIKPKDLKGKSILDVGCNIGGFSSFCSPHCRRYLGIDVFAPSIEMARRMFQFSNCTFRVQSFTDLREESIYDVILALAVRRYTGMSFKEFTQAAADLLTPAGTMYYESHTREKLRPVVKRTFSALFHIKRTLSIPGTSKKECRHSRFFVELEKR